jgi:xanthine dehydrogenase accessory factor
MAHSLSRFLSEHNDTIKVELTRVRGSSPREEGAFMVVANTSIWGTIGGGQLEYMAIDQARALLKSGGENTFMDVPLGPEIGQCCGGRVEVQLVRLNNQSKEQLCNIWAHTKETYPHVYILGAGHVGRALADFFEKLPVRAIIIDGRSAELGMCHATIEHRQSALPEKDVREAPAGQIVFN